MEVLIGLILLILAVVVIIIAWSALSNLGEAVNVKSRNFLKSTVVESVVHNNEIMKTIEEKDFNLVTDDAVFDKLGMKGRVK